MRLTQWYRRAAEWHTEPVIQHVYGLISADEGRHAGAYLKYMKRAVESVGDEARHAFAKVGVLMASNGRRGGPTNLTRREIAGELSVSLNTVDTHIRRIYAKLGVADRTAAVERGRELRLLSVGRT